MEWFEKFVADCAQRWAEIQPSEPRVASFREWLEDFEGTATELGEFGEQFVADLVRKSGYTVGRPPGSRTPADVWAIRPGDMYTHIGLIQVKAAVEGGQPKRLAGDDQEGLKALAGFIGSRLLKSVFVPTEVRKIPLFISTGYAGVLLHPLELTATLESSHYLDLVYSKTLRDDLKKLRGHAISFHRLG
jgi:hypothetical protein